MAGALSQEGKRRTRDSRIGRCVTRAVTWLKAGEGRLGGAADATERRSGQALRRSRRQQLKRTTTRVGVGSGGDKMLKSSKDRSCCSKGGKGSGGGGGVRL